MLQALSVRGDGSILGDTFEALCQPGVLALLLGAENLTALSIDLRTIPRSPAMLQYLPLRHLEVNISGWKVSWFEGLFADVSCSRSLESLKIVYKDNSDPAAMIESALLPSMNLCSMPSLKHVRLDSCLPVHELSLPDDCALVLDVVCGVTTKWHEHSEKFQRHTIVLRLASATLPRDCAVWPVTIQEFTRLQYLELYMTGSHCQHLADLRHIPHVKVIADDQANLQLTGCSWQTFELFQFGKLQVDIADVNSFVRDTRSFTFMSESQPGASNTLMQRVGDACQRQRKTCHDALHCKKQCGRWGAKEGEWVHYVIMSTSKEMAENFPVIFNYDDSKPRMSFGRGKPLADRETFWPRDPCASVKRK